jgi:hypothetical protein
MPCRTSKSSTLLHHQVHSFMAHGVDPLVEIGGQHLAPHGDVCLIFLWEGEHTRIQNLQNKVLTNTQHKYMYKMNK